MPLDLVGIREIAERLGVANVTVRKWHSGGKMPEPDGHVSGFPAWRWERVERWARKEGKLTV